MQSPWYITKSSGQQELFDPQKFRTSLERAGADQNLINQLETAVQEHGGLTSTRDVFGFALALLQERNLAVASRYNLKNALFQLGPEGFTFEQLVSLIFKEQGYTVTTDQILIGFCVGHEVDVVAEKNHHINIIECKFHNAPGIKADVKIPLYVKARCDDVVKALKAQQTSSHTYVGWVATNTKFTSEAIQYAQCVELQLLGWSYPAHDNLQSLITRYRLYPITCIPTLSRAQKQQLIQENILLCRDLVGKERMLHALGLTSQQITHLQASVEKMCRL